MAGDKRKGVSVSASVSVSVSAVKSAVSEPSAQMFEQIPTFNCVFSGLKHVS